MKMRPSILVPLCLLTAAGCGSGGGSDNGIVPAFQARIATKAPDLPAVAPTNVPGSQASRARTATPAAKHIPSRAYVAEDGAFVARLGVDQGLTGGAPSGGKKVGIHSPPIVRAPARSTGFFHLEDSSGMAIDARVRGAEDVKGRAVDGYVVYPNAVRGGHWIHEATRDGVEDYVSFDHDAGETSLSYDVALSNVASLRLVGNSLEFLDKGGAPRLRVPAPYVVGSDHERHAAKLAVSGCTVDTSPLPPWGRQLPAVGASSCTVQVDWSGVALAYPAVIDPSWTTTASMSAARQRHAAALTNGRVLVAGGPWVGPAEIYDPATNSWSITGSLTDVRYDLDMAALPDGRVMVTGGYGIRSGYTQTIPTTELWDPATGTWTSAGNLATSRAIHQATALADGSVLVTGGTHYEVDIANEVVASAERWYDGQWHPVPALATIRHAHTATLLQDGRVLVAGGNIIDETKSAEVFDPVSEQWTATGHMGPIQAWPYTVQRTLHAATLLPNGHVLAAGGVQAFWGDALSTTEEYDPATNAWTSAGSLSSPRGFLKGVTSSGREVFVGGANGSWYPLQPPLTNVDTFDGSTWASDEPLATPRLFHTATAFPGGILVTGGVIDNQAIASVEVALTPPTTVPQPPCGTHPTEQQGAEIEARLQALRNVRAVLPGSAPPVAGLHAPGTIAIPVYFHVITDGNTGAITDFELGDQLRAINQVFAGAEQSPATPFRFILAGINRRDNSAWHHVAPGSPAVREMTTALRVGGQDVLNVYTIDAHPTNWGEFPDSYNGNPVGDGVFVSWSYFKNTNGKATATIVHEIGHWLGLFHTFENYGNANRDCQPPGDEVEDTPPHKVPVLFSCVPDENSCGMGAPGDLPDPIHNFMNYTSDDCEYEFTWGQRVRMDEMYAAFRAGGNESIVLLGGPGWSTIPTATLGVVNDVSKFVVVNRPTDVIEPGGTTLGNPDFPSHTGDANVHPLFGDFDGDSYTDIALTGPSPQTNGSYWSLLPIAYPVGDGSFFAWSRPVGNFQDWSAGAQPHYRFVGDFDANGRADVMLFGTSSSWDTLSLLSNRPGEFIASQWTEAGFGDVYRRLGVKSALGDFDRDGSDDIVLIGDTTSPLHHIWLGSHDGALRMDLHTVFDGYSSTAAPSFHALASESGVTALVGDFDGDRAADIALVGSANGSGIPIALSRRDGSFSFFNPALAEFAALARGTGALPFAADFNADGKTDIALIGGQGWNTIPVAFAAANESFTFANLPVDADFGAKATKSSTSILIGDFDRDGRADVALLGGVDDNQQLWPSIPIALARGNAPFTVVHIEPSDMQFMEWAATSGVSRYAARVKRPQ